MNDETFNREASFDVGGVSRGKAKVTGPPRRVITAGLTQAPDLSTWYLPGSSYETLEYGPGSLFEPSTQELLLLRDPAISHDQVYPVDLTTPPFILSICFGLPQELCCVSQQLGTAHSSPPSSSSCEVMRNSKGYPRISFVLTGTLSKAQFCRQVLVAPQEAWHG